VEASQLNWLTAVDVARAIRDGAISSEQLVEACLARVREVEPTVQAWQHLDPEHALAQARSRDQDRSAGEAVGPLHGVPMGIKDIFDTCDMPTEDGSVLHAGRTPAEDAAAVAMLRAAGAVIMGKTVTTEFAAYAPGKTRNPRNAAHTPGGSSSGSAAAVAAGMVPVALGSQTNGSTIRPASFCGVFGFKPSHGLVPRSGILRLSRTLDQVGVFARSLEDIALTCEQIAGYHEGDPDTRPRARAQLLGVLGQDPPFPPTFGWVRTPMWDSVDPDAKEAFAELKASLGGQIVDFELPQSALAALEWHRTIMEAEMAANLDREYEVGRARLSEALRAQLERGRTVSALEYQRALARIPALNEGFGELFERCDAILTPAAQGTAPQGLESTGSPAFCTLWTLCGMPALSLPLMQGENGLPLGAQLVGARGGDARLLRTARWLVERISGEADRPH